MIVIANVFSKLQTVKNVVRTLSKKCRLREPFDSQLVKTSQILAKYHENAFIMFFIILRKVDFENVSLSDRRNLTSGC